MKKKLIVFVCCCWLVVLNLIFSEPIIGNVLIALGFDKNVMVVFQWVFGLAVLLGAGIPFGYWIVKLSDWFETVIDESSIYKSRKDD
ncbi:hypothetical protein BFP76_03500 [Amylibacter kogurei]|uniref:Uncharacterized protein n=1 Tax=Paramylibacter kogurei TaxID=1889778 RepID=A0A2G5K596_9RHOB|nr:hypothetical protein BFP76_03500 [Amylibacter kogurei]